MYFYYSKQNGRVAMYSETPCQTSNLCVKELEIAEKDLEKLKQNYECFVENDSLQIKKSFLLLESEKQKAFEKEKKEVEEMFNSGEDVKVERLYKLIEKLF